MSKFIEFAVGMAELMFVTITGGDRTAVLEKYSDERPTGGIAQSAADLVR